MTESRWELTIVLLVSSTVFLSAWHFAAQFIAVYADGPSGSALGEDTTHERG
jgi:hypothetical protein